MEKQQKTVVVIGAGYKGGQPIGGCEKGPKVIRNTGVINEIGSLNWRVEDKGDLEFDAIVNEDATTTNTKNSRVVGSACSKIYNAISDQAKLNKFCLTLGGDHSLAIGSIAGMCSAYPDLTVVWVDAHADINTPITSPTGNIHGMPIAFLMGLIDSSKIRGFEWLKPCLKPSNLVYVGLRDVDSGERKILAEHGIQAFSMHEVDKYGISKVMEMALDHINPDRSKPIHLSFDVDGIDPGIVPSTGTRVRGGLNWREARYICETLHQTNKLVGMDVVEVNPDIGSESDVKQTAEVAADIIKVSLGHTLLH